DSVGPEPLAHHVEQPVHGGFVEIVEHLRCPDEIKGLGSQFRIIKRIGAEKLRMFMLKPAPVDLFVSCGNDRRPVVETHIPVRFKVSNEGFSALEWPAAEVKQPMPGSKAQSSHRIELV